MDRQPMAIRGEPPHCSVIAVPRNAAALQQGADPQLTRTRRNQPHLGPFEWQQHHAVAQIAAIGLRKSQNMQCTVQERRMHTVLAELGRQFKAFGRTRLHTQAASFALFGIDDDVTARLR